jgi:hypothetical protein
MTLFCDIPRIVDIQLCRNKKKKKKKTGLFFVWRFQLGVEINVSDGDGAAAKDSIQKES